VSDRLFKSFAPQQADDEIDKAIDFEQKSQAAVRIAVGVLEAHAEARKLAAESAAAAKAQDMLTDADRARLQVLANLLKGPYAGAVLPIVQAAFPMMGQKRGEA
jgi:hypothetical protein